MSDTPPEIPPFRNQEEEPSSSELARFKAFIFIQILFLGASPLAGGFNFKVWSMLDTALLILSLGISALAFVLESRQGRRLVFRTAALLYILGVIDMAYNILRSGVVGWKGFS
ncbi:MAG: hypothetical protein HQ519_05890 [Planctomycetes bacterium]|nr:hypothetical protein [Planctomycetota bacterium]